MKKVILVFIVTLLTAGSMFSQTGWTDLKKNNAFPFWEWFYEKDGDLALIDDQIYICTHPNGHIWRVNAGTDSDQLYEMGQIDTTSKDWQLQAMTSHENYLIGASTGESTLFFARIEGDNMYPTTIDLDDDTIEGIYSPVKYIDDVGNLNIYFAASKTGGSNNLYVIRWVVPFYNGSYQFGSGNQVEIIPSQTSENKNIICKSMHYMELYGVPVLAFGLQGVNKISFFSIVNNTFAGGYVPYSDSFPKTYNTKNILPVKQGTFWYIYIFENDFNGTEYIGEFLPDVGISRDHEIPDNIYNTDERSWFQCRKFYHESSNAIFTPEYKFELQRNAFTKIVTNISDRKLYGQKILELSNGTLVNFFGWDHPNKYYSKINPTDATGTVTFVNMMNQSSDYGREEILGMAVVGDNIHVSSHFNDNELIHDPSPGINEWIIQAVSGSQSDAIFPFHNKVYYGNYSGPIFAYRNTPTGSISKTFNVQDYIHDSNQTHIFAMAGDGDFVTFGTYVNWSNSNTTNARLLVYDNDIDKLFALGKIEGETKITNLIIRQTSSAWSGFRIYGTTHDGSTGNSDGIFILESDRVDMGERDYNTLIPCVREEAGGAADIAIQNDKFYKIVIGSRDNPENNYEGAYLYEYPNLPTTLAEIGDPGNYEKFKIYNTTGERWRNIAFARMISGNHGDLFISLKLMEDDQTKYNSRIYYIPDVEDLNNTTWEPQLIYNVYDISPDYVIQNMDVTEYGSAYSLVCGFANGALRKKLLVQTTPPILKEKAITSQGYPNPFNPETNIVFNMPEQAHVKIEIYNTLGQRVTTLFDDIAEKGETTVKWNAAGLATGVYIYRLESQDFVQTQKLLFLK